MPTQQNAKSSSTLSAIIGTLVFLGAIWYFYGGGLEKHATKEMNKIENQVAIDAEKEYEIVKSNGSAMDAYVRASMVAEAYLQAGDQYNYKKWKDIEKKDAKAAGISDN